MKYYIKDSIKSRYKMLITFCIIYINFILNFVKVEVKFTENFLKIFSTFC